MYKLLILLSIIFLTFSCASQTGEACETDSDCDVDLICEKTFPGGYCTKYDCNHHSSGSCGDEAQCTYFSDINRAYCLSKCNSNSDCRSQYSCQSVENNKYKTCLPEK